MPTKVIRTITDGQASEVTFNITDRQAYIEKVADALRNTPFYRNDPDAVDAWIDGNVTNMVGVRTALKRIARQLILLTDYDLGEG